MAESSASGDDHATASSNRTQIMKNDLLLHEAVIKNDTEAVADILKQPCDVNSRNNYGRAPIHWAASRGSTDIIKLLVKANCDIEARDKYGMRPLLMATWHGHLDAVKCFIQAGACVAATNKKQQGLLACAARNNRTSVLQYVLKSIEPFGDILDAPDAEGLAPIAQAAHAGHTNTVRLLAEAGANVNITNQARQTPLHAACESGHTEVVSILLSRGANLNAVDEDGDTSLHIAAANQHTELVRCLVTAGSEVDCENERGLTPLHLACNESCHGIIDILLSNGASVHKRSKSGNTALHIACTHDQVEIVDLLLAKGADIHCVNQVGQTALHVAAEGGQTEVARKLLASGAGPAARASLGQLPLRVAARGSFSAIFDIIIATTNICQRGASPNVSANEDASKKTTSVLKRLLSRDDSCRMGSQDAIKEMLWKLAYRQLSAGEWKRLAYYWNFTDEQVCDIERQYTGTASYKEHGYRMLIAWRQKLPPTTSVLCELEDGLVTIGKRKLAEAIRASFDRENSTKKTAAPCHCASCSIT